MTAETTPENALVQALSAVDPIEQMRSVVLAAREHDSLISRQWVSGWADQWEQERATLAEKCRRLEDDLGKARARASYWKNEHIAANLEIEKLADLKVRLAWAEADRDSWCDQANERTKDWDEMRQRAEKAEAERDKVRLCAVSTSQLS